MADPRDQTDPDATTSTGDIGPFPLMNYTGSYSDTTAPAAEPQPSTDDHTLLEHSVRCWDAERENAARISQQVRLLSGAVLVLLGLGLYKVQWLYDPSHESRLWCWELAATMKGLLALSIPCFAASLFAMHWHRRHEDEGRPPNTASKQLALWRVDAKGNVPRRVARRVYKAYAELRRQNERKWERLQKGEKWFEVGFVLVLATILLYVVGSVPPMPDGGPADVSNGNRGPAAESAPAEGRDSRSDSRNGARVRESRAGDRESGRED